MDRPIPRWDNTPWEPYGPADQRIPDAFGDVFWLRALPEEPGVLKGCVFLFGVLYHLRFIAVAPDPQTGEQGAVGDPHDWFRDLRALDPEGGPYQTVRVPGYPGEYVAFVIPGK